MHSCYWLELASLSNSCWVICLFVWWKWRNCNTSESQGIRTISMPWASKYLDCEISQLRFTFFRYYNFFPSDILSLCLHILSCIDSIWITHPATGSNLISHLSIWVAFKVEFSPSGSHWLQLTVQADRGGGGQHLLDLAPAVWRQTPLHWVSGASHLSVWYTVCRSRLNKEHIYDTSWFMMIDE